MSIMVKDANDTKTRYGVIVILTQDEEVLMSRRLDTTHFSKKWQLPSGYLSNGEPSYDACIRVLEHQTDIACSQDQFIFIGSLDLKEHLNEFYYIYAVNVPLSVKLSDKAKKETKHRSDWRFFELDRATVLDSAPGIRDITLRLKSGLEKAKQKVTRIDKIKTQKLPVLRNPIQEQVTQKCQGCDM